MAAQRSDGQRFNLLTHYKFLKPQHKNTLHARMHPHYFFDENGHAARPCGSSKRPEKSFGARLCEELEKERSAIKWLYDIESRLLADHAAGKVLNWRVYHYIERARELEDLDRIDKAKVAERKSAGEARSSGTASSNGAGEGVGCEPSVDI